MSRNEQLLKELQRQKDIFAALKSILGEMILASKNRDSEKVIRLTDALSNRARDAERADSDLTIMVHSEAARLGLTGSHIKLKNLDPSPETAKAVDELRELVSEVAGESARAAGILSANMEVLAQTVQVLKALDSRGAGYTEKGGPSDDDARPRSSSKMIDKTA